MGQDITVAPPGSIEAARDTALFGFRLRHAAANSEQRRPSDAGRTSKFRPARSAKRAHRCQRT